MNILHHAHNSVIYVYNRIAPITDQSEMEGTLIVVTDRAPNDAWLAYVDLMRTKRSLLLIYGAFDYPPTLGIADLTFILRGGWPEQVHCFPGCYHL